MTIRNPTEADVDRAMLAAELRGQGQQLAHIGSMISGRQAVTAADLRLAREAVRLADQAIARFAQRQPVDITRETR